jgi:hypothetical protein
MRIRLATKAKLGVGAGALTLLAFPLTAHAATTSSSTLPSPTASLSSSSPSSSTLSSSTLSSPASTLSSATNTASSLLASPQPAPTSTVTAPVTSALAPRAADSTSTATVPAPGATADAYAAQVAGVVAISHTHASASGSGTSSTADPVEIGGNPPASQFGGTESGPGNQSGSLVDTGPSSQFRLALAPWADSNTQNSASAISDIVLLDLGDQSTAQSASVRVLQSTSNATWSPSQSSANSSSDGAIITAGGPSGLYIDVLHAETNSSGAGQSYLVSINGNEIGSSSQVNGQCTLTIPSLLSLDCLTATGGTAGNIASQAAGVLDVTLGGTPAGANIGLIQASNSSGSPATPSVSSSSGGAQGSGSGGGQGSGGGGSAGSPGPAAASASQPATAASASLPFTGADIVVFLLTALALGLAGAALVWAARRFRMGAA